MKSPLKKYIEKLEKDKPQPKVIREYFDEKRQCVVKVLAGVQDRPMQSIPVGGGEEFTF